jgi:hypothetical protein
MLLSLFFTGAGRHFSVDGWLVRRIQGRGLAYSTEQPLSAPAGPYHQEKHHA